MTRTVLLVEPDEEEANVLAAALKGSGYEVASVGSAADLHTALDKITPSAIVCELNLPDNDGLVILPWLIKRARGAPVMVCSRRQSRADRVLALRMGADDYITKPYYYAEFEARLESLLRVTARIPIAEKLQVGVLTRDTRLGGTLLVGRQPVAVTPTEDAVMRVLMLHPEEVVPYQQILEEVWGTRANKYTGVHLLMTVASRLRVKLASAGLPDAIRAIRGIGFTLAADPNLSEERDIESS